MSWFFEGLPLPLWELYHNKYENFLSRDLYKKWLFRSFFDDFFRNHQIEKSSSDFKILMRFFWNAITHMIIWSFKKSNPRVPNLAQNFFWKNVESWKFYIHPKNWPLRSNFVKRSYKARITLSMCSDIKLVHGFLSLVCTKRTFPVEMRLTPVSPLSRNQVKNSLF